MYRKNFMRLCNRTLCPIDIIFNTVHYISDINSMYKFKAVEEYLQQLEREQTDGQTNKPNA